ncbi:MAG: hypothetical protein ABL958_16140 [Bdellovibrionia bacterium]
MTLLTLLLATLTAHASVNCAEQVNHQYGHYAPLIVEPAKVKIERRSSFFYGVYQFDVYIEGKYYVSFSKTATPLAPIPLSFPLTQPDSLTAYARLDLIANRWADLLAVAEQTKNVVRLDIREVRQAASPWNRCLIDSMSLKKVLTVGSESTQAPVETLPRGVVRSQSGDEFLTPHRAPNGDRSP